MGTYQIYIVHLVNLFNEMKINYMENFTIWQMKTVKRYTEQSPELKQFMILNLKYLFSLLVFHLESMACG
jgi:hypothetical protein